MPVLLSVVSQILGEVLVNVESGENLRLRRDIGHATKHWQYFFQGLSSIDSLKSVAKLVMGIPSPWYNSVIGASWATSTDGVITGIRSLSDLSPCEDNCAVGPDIIARLLDVLIRPCSEPVHFVYEVVHVTALHQEDISIGQ